VRLIEIMDGFTEITLGTDVLASASRDPLTAARQPTGVRVTLNFQRRQPLPTDTLVNIRYDLAENGCEREARGVPRLIQTVMHGENVFYQYRLAHWLPPHAVMRFLPRNVRQPTEGCEEPTQNILQVSMSGLAS
jgi:hypothetical protein